MMKGNNELHLNEETVCEAIQHWLSRSILEPVPKVTGFKKGPSPSSRVVFVVTLSSGEDGQDV